MATGRFRNTSFRNPDIGASIADLGTAFLQFQAAKPRNELIREEARLNNALKRRNLNLIDMQMAKQEKADMDAAALRDIASSTGASLGDILLNPTMMQVDRQVPIPEGIRAPIQSDVNIGDFIEPAFMSDEALDLSGANPPQFTLPEGFTEAIKGLPAQAPMGTETVNQVNIPAVQQSVFRTAVDALQNSPDPAKTQEFVNNFLNVAALSDDPRIRQLAPTIKAAMAEKQKLDDASDRTMKEKKAEQDRDFEGRENLEKLKGAQSRLTEITKGAIAKGERQKVTTQTSEDMEVLGRQVIGTMEMDIEDDDFLFLRTAAEELLANGATPTGAWEQVINQLTRVEDGFLWFDDNLVLTDQAELDSKRVGEKAFKFEMIDGKKVPIPGQKRLDEDGNSVFFPDKPGNKTIDEGEESPDIGEEIERIKTGFFSNLPSDVKRSVDVARRQTKSVGPRGRKRVNKTEEEQLNDILAAFETIQNADFRDRTRGGRGKSKVIKTGDEVRDEVIQMFLNEFPQTPGPLVR